MSIRHQKIFSRTEICFICHTRKTVLYLAKSSYPVPYAGRKRTPRAAAHRNISKAGNKMKTWKSKYKLSRILLKI